jgi:eukaryotic-like serine/threonine-protein kinase
MSADAELLKRVSALFDELHELAAPEQVHALAKLHDAEPEVAAELSRWLAKDQESDAAFTALTGRLQAAVMGLPLAAKDRSGQRIGAYELLRRIGRGGMGEVYEAHRPGIDFEQKIAIKLLRRGLDSEDIVRRFLRERRILAQLEHPGIARLIDGGLSDDGLPYLVMEYVDGQSLIEAANARSLDLATRLQLFLRICDAVTYAHRRLIVHRDLKPSNVLLTADNQPKLLDFGIAKLLDEVDEEHLTSTGMRVLTPGYAAPEQILGHPISTATDVYALGVILYELITGLSPHQRRGKDLERVTRDLEQESITRPSAALLQSLLATGTAQIERQRLARQLNGDIDTIVLHALKREPERRYQDAAELADDIRRHLNGHPVRAEADTLSYRMRKFVTRHRGGVTAASLALLGIVSGLLIALWQAGVARDQALRAEHQAERAELIKDFFASMFHNSSPMRQRRGAQLTAREWIEDAASRIDTDLKDAPEAQAEIRVALSQVLLEFDADTEAAALLEPALVHLRTAGKSSANTLSSALQLLSRIQRKRGELDAAQQSIEQALLANADIADRQLRLDGSLQIRTYQLTLANARAQPDQALSIARALLADRIERYGQNDTRVAVDWNNLGATLIKLGHSAESESSLMRALALLQADPKSPEARQANVFTSLCIAQLGQGKLASALASANQAEEIAIRSMGSDSQITQRVLGCKTKALSYLGRNEEVMAIVAAVRTPGNAHFPELHRYMGMIHGALLLSDGHIKEAREVLTEVRTEFPTDTHGTPLVTIETDLTFALALAHQGDSAQALAITEAALQKLATQHLTRGQQKGEFLMSAAINLALCGQHDRARPMHAEGLALWRAAWADGDAPVPHRPLPLSAPATSP